MPSFCSFSSRLQVNCRFSRLPMNKVYNEMCSCEDMVFPAQTKDLVGTPFVPSLPDVLPPQAPLKLQFRKPFAPLVFADDERFFRQEVKDWAQGSGCLPRTFGDENACQKAIVTKEGRGKGQQGHSHPGSDLKWRLLPKKYADALLHTHTPPNLSSCCYPGTGILLPFSEF